MALATLVLGDINLSASTIIWWLIIGLVVGVIASFIMRGGYGIVADIIIGIVGAFIGGFLASLIGVSSGGSLILTLIIAVIGACILIAILRAVSGGYGRRRRL
ncbi:MAG TPA: GlsB/YeaQ/YmgE family stress response membrane protein [Ktedonobacteraceae bacterium]|nr:GlsB/YeaQ/YmgE family stress response membrane protein [Ktedonobacteraceae bacterium]